MLLARSGRRGRKFESSHPDQVFFNEIKGPEKFGRGFARANGRNGTKCSKSVPNFSAFRFVHLRPAALASTLEPPVPGLSGAAQRQICVI